MKALIDTNIWLDITLNREPFAAMSQLAVMVCIEEGVDSLIAATSVKDVFYVVSKVKTTDEAYEAIETILDIAEVSPIDGLVCRKALNLERPDYEDGIIAACGSVDGIDCIITRDANAFREVPFLKCSPEEFVKAQGYEEIEF